MLDEENGLFFLFVFLLECGEEGADLVCLGGYLVFFLDGILVLSGGPMFNDSLGI